MQKKEEKNKFDFLIFILHSLLGLAAMLISLLVFASLVSTELISANSMTVVACFSAFLSSLVASVLSAVKFGKKLITALLQGLFYFLFIYLIGGIIFMRLIPSVVTPWILISCFSGSLLGAIILTFFRIRKK